jgi:hypothetical protein
MDPNSNQTEIAMIDAVPATLQNNLWSDQQYGPDKLRTLEVNALHKIMCNFKRVVVPT